MSFRISSNTASMAANRALEKSSNAMAQSSAKLSSGERITRAGDDASGLAISERLKSQIRSKGQALRNANDGVGLLQVAEGGLGEIGNILSRLRELGVQSASDTVADQERLLINTEYIELKTEIDRISKSTRFNGKSLLTGLAPLDFQVDINNSQKADRIRYQGKKMGSTTDQLGIASTFVHSKESAREVLGKIDNAMKKLSGQRAELGAVQNRLTSSIDQLQVSREGLSSANSQIRDTQYAAETATNIKEKIKTEAGANILKTTNIVPEMALKLL